MRPAPSRTSPPSLGTFHWGKAGPLPVRPHPRAAQHGLSPNGSYRVTVTAADTAGNLGSRSTIVEIEQGPTGRLQIAADTRCAAAPVPTMAERSGIYGHPPG